MPLTQCISTSISCPGRNSAMRMSSWTGRKSASGKRSVWFPKGTHVMCLLYTAKRSHKHQPAAASKQVTHLYRTGDSKNKFSRTESTLSLWAHRAERKAQILSSKTKKKHLFLGEISPLWLKYSSSGSDDSLAAWGFRLHLIFSWNCRVSISVPSWSPARKHVKLHFCSVYRTMISYFEEYFYSIQESHLGFCTRRDEGQLG